ncbi:NA+/H+ antiporter (napA), putative [hydrothermal vent metagenome]|uniref:NA+/H+ antiporter (NapA), putative n=1 Tax=hydrothermal vent metagenome TaxID=652676 RepID=A0A3B1E121_9ZZZZ
MGSIAVSLGLISSNYIFNLVAELGFLYLMFLAGLEINLKALFKVPVSIIKKAFMYTLLLYVLSIILALYLDLSNIFIVTLPLISIGLLAALKKEYGDVKWLSLAITVGLIGEIASIFVLTTVSAGLEFGLTFEFYKTLAVLGSIFIAMIFIYKLFHNLIWWYPELKRKLMPEVDTQEQDIRLSMAIFFMMIALMLYLHLEVALGTFIAGVFIATFFEHNKELPHKLEHFGFGWLVPIFFIWIGTSFELKSLFVDNLINTALLITFAMILIRVISSSLFINDIGLKSSFLLALSHSQPLTLLIAVATLAFHNNSITQFYYFAFILSAIFEVMISMILIRVFSKTNTIT